MPMTSIEPKNMTHARITYAVSRIPHDWAEKSVHIDKHFSFIYSFDREHGVHLFTGITIDDKFMPKYLINLLLAIKT